jgi:hypothetical protein
MKRIVEFAHDIGDPVVVEAVGMAGRVEALLRDADGAQFCVIYWNDGSRHSVWLYEWELAKVHAAKTKDTP